MEALQAQQVGRSILVQPLDGVRGKETPWVELGRVGRGQELWTRSVCLNELLFDVDLHDWGRVADTTHQLVSSLRRLGVPHYSGPTGGKGTHTSVFVDASTIHVPRALLDRARRLGIDVWSQAREVLAEALLNAAGFPEAPEARWAGPERHGFFDRLKVRWSAARAGSMVRVLGCAGSTGARKTLAPHDYDWHAAARLPGPPPLPLKFHYAPETWSVPKLIAQRVPIALEEACDAKERVANQETPNLNKLEAARLFKNVPCVARALIEPAPNGNRHYTFLNLVAIAKRLGLPRGAAERALHQSMAQCGLPPTHERGAVLDEVYQGRYAVTNLRCPSPHVQAWCDPNACPLAKGYEFS